MQAWIITKRGRLDLTSALAGSPTRTLTGTVPPERLGRELIWMLIWSAPLAVRAALEARPNSKRRRRRHSSFVFEADCLQAVRSAKECGHSESTIETLAQSRLLTRRANLCLSAIQIRAR